jgi:class 3 adenylate cyclase
MVIQLIQRQEYAHRPICWGKVFYFSKALHDKLNTDIDIISEDLGEHSLKGKDEKIHIYSI